MQRPIAGSLLQWRLSLARSHSPDSQRPYPEIWFAVVAADSLIIVAALRDLVVLRRVHPVWLIAGTAVIVEQSVEVISFDSPLWRATAQVLYDAIR